LNYGLARIRLDVAHTIVTGLQRLEYRGYDSAGITLDGTDDTINVFKEVGPVVNLLNLVNEQLGDQVRFCFLGFFTRLYNACSFPFHLSTKILIELSLSLSLSNLFCRMVNLSIMQEWAIHAGRLMVPFMFEIAIPTSQV
jgi:hypothetical protein